MYGVLAGSQLYTSAKVYVLNQGIRQHNGICLGPYKRQLSLTCSFTWVLPVLYCKSCTVIGNVYKLWWAFIWKLNISYCWSWATIGYEETLAARVQIVFYLETFPFPFMFTCLFYTIFMINCNNFICSRHLLIFTRLIIVYLIPIFFLLFISV